MIIKKLIADGDRLVMYTEDQRPSNWTKYCGCGHFSSEVDGLTKCKECSK